MAKLDNDNVKIEVLRLVNDGLSYRQIEERTGVSRSAVNSFILKKTHKAWWDKRDHKPIASGQLYDHHTNIKKLNKSRYIITSAQNNTYVHRQFLESLEVMSEHIDAQIIVGTFSYNTNGFQNLQKGDGEWFDPLIMKYILDEPVELAGGLMYCGELNILPTAVNPLSGLHSYTKSASGVIPHAKVQLESIPTHKSEPCKMMYTTGAITKRNYIQKKTGQKASFHHIFGALLVEVDDDGDWFARQLIAESDTGRFQDLTTLYTPYGYYEDQRVEAMNWGDIHVEKLDMDVAEASFMGPDSILDVLKPKYQFIHDVLDFEARNHHNINDPYFRFNAYVNRKDTVESNVMSVRWLLQVLEREYSQSVVVESNHDLALTRWLRESDYKNDPQNALFFLECQLEVYRAIARGEKNFSILEHKVKEKGLLDDVVFLMTDESFRICDNNGDGIECGQHGHLGANGSKGGVAVYQKLGIRYNIGHGHGAFIKDGVYMAGVSGRLEMGYNKGASNWSHSHIVTYPNGKRAIITLKDGKWRA